MLSVPTFKLPRKVAIKIAKAEKIVLSKEDNKKKFNSKFKVIVLGGKKKESSQLVEDENGNPMWDFSCVVKIHRGQTDPICLLVEDSDGHHKGQVIIPLVKIGPKPHTNNIGQLPTTSSNLICSELEPTSKCSNPSGYLIYWIWVEEFSSEEGNVGRKSFNKSVTSLFGSKSALGSVKSRKSVPVGSSSNIGSVTSLNKPEKVKRSLFSSKVKKDKTIKTSSDYKKATPDSSDVDDFFELEHEFNNPTPFLSTTNIAIGRPDIAFSTSNLKNSKEYFPPVTKPSIHSAVNISSTPVIKDDSHQSHMEDHINIDDEAEAIKSESLKATKNKIIDPPITTISSDEDVDSAVPSIPTNEYNPFTNSGKTEPMQHPQTVFVSGNLSAEERMGDTYWNHNKYNPFDDTPISMSEQNILITPENPIFGIPNKDSKTHNPFKFTAASLDDFINTDKVNNEAMDPRKLENSFHSLSKAPPGTSGIMSDDTLFGNDIKDLVKINPFDQSFESLSLSTPKENVTSYENTASRKVDKDFNTLDGFPNTFESYQSPPALTLKGNLDDTVSDIFNNDIQFTSHSPPNKDADKSLVLKRENKSPSYDFGSPINGTSMDMDIRLSSEDIKSKTITEQSPFDDLAEPSKHISLNVIAKDEPFLQGQLLAESKSVMTEMKSSDAVTLKESIPQHVTPTPKPLPSARSRYVITGNMSKTPSKTKEGDIFPVPSVDVSASPLEGEDCNPAVNYPSTNLNKVKGQSPILKHTTESVPFVIKTDNQVKPNDSLVDDQGIKDTIAIMNERDLPSISFSNTKSNKNELHILKNKKRENNILLKLSKEENKEDIENALHKDELSIKKNIPSIPKSSNDCLTEEISNPDISYRDINHKLLANIKSLNEEGDLLRKENSDLKSQNIESLQQILELRSELDDVKDSLFKLRTRLLEEGAMEFLEKI